jgi:uncharacterized protein YciI
MTMASVDARIEELMRGMLRKTLYVVLWKGAGRELKAELPAHLENMIDLERQGKIFASGPLDSGATGDGLTVLRASSKEEAREIALRDPLVTSGLRTFEVREWLLMEGSIAVKVNYSSGTFEIV